MQESPLLRDLNPAQKQAVLETSGPVLVYAGAGSGKTRALTHRIAYLIKEKKVSPWNILAVTFTNKAADEMRHRITSLLGLAPNPLAPLAGSAGRNLMFSSDLPTIGTFHAVSTRILRKHIHLLNYENSFNIYDDTDSLILMRRLMKDMGLDEKSLNPKSVLAQIGGAKNALIGPEAYAARAGTYFEERVAKLYAPYEASLQKANALDFDDLIMKTVILFREWPEVLEHFQNQFQFIHIDEYQDTNHMQYMWTKLLAQKNKNLCVIGDSDQSIYSWRGANMQNILDFEKDYPNAKVILMEENYRSTQPILDAAHSVIVKNRKRKDKKLWTKNEGGKLLDLFTAENERHEAEFVVRKISEVVKMHEHADYRDFVALYRTNAQSRALEEAFLQYGMPYKIVGGVQFYQRKEVKDMLAYLRVVQNPNDLVSVLRILNVPQRKIGPKTIETLQEFAQKNHTTLFQTMVRIDEVEGLPDTKKKAVEKFLQLIANLRKRNREFPASGLVKFILEESGYKKMLDDGSVESEARLENIGELVSVASKYDRLEPGVSLSVFLEEVALISDLDRLNETENAVTLMTLHQAKGLEFPWVFICGLEEGLLPHSRSILDPQQLEEERRLLYVGMTRAMERLFLLWTKTRLLYGEYQNSVPSQFLSDIPPELFDSGPGGKTHMLLEQIGDRPIPFE